MNMNYKNKLHLRELTKEDRERLYALIALGERELENQEFWLPVDIMSREHFLDRKWTRFLGAYIEEELIGSVGLFLNKYEYGEVQEILKLENKKVAELGRAMVHPNHRNHGIMKLLVSKLLEIAKELEIENLVATVHPNNIPSQKLLHGIHMEKKAFCYKKNKYPRDIMVLKM